MAAPNSQPFGSRGTAAAPHTHEPHAHGKPTSGSSPIGQGVAPHATPGKVGANKKNPLK